MFVMVADTLHVPSGDEQAHRTPTFQDRPGEVGQPVRRPMGTMSRRVLPRGARIGVGHRPHLSARNWAAKPHSGS
jgi:hypothetical protein